MTENETNISMSIGDHLEELRRRIIYALGGLIVAMGVSLFFGKEILAILEHPYLRVTSELGLNTKLIVLKVSEGFLIYIRVSLIGGILMSSPWIFYHFWMFVSTGLKQREKRYVYWSIPFSVILFASGAMFFLFVASIPLMLFFVGFNNFLGLETTLTLKNHISMMTTMMMTFGIGFQMPLVIAILGAVGLVTTRTLKKYRRHVIVILLIFAAMVTSPSPIDQVLLAVPMWLLYELGILLVWLKSRAKMNDSEE